MPISKLRATPRAKALIASIVAATVAGYVVIFPEQPKVYDDVALAIKTAMPWEGRELVAYLDRIAKPPVWTVCDGDTDHVRPGLVETPAGCDQRTAMKMEKRYRPALVSCVAKWDNKPLAWRGMMLSLSWNNGTGGACGSTAARIDNDATRLGKHPDYLASCNVATAFNKAGGHMIIGIVHRREMGDASRFGEGELCVSGSDHVWLWHIRLRENRRRPDRRRGTRLLSGALDWPERRKANGGDGRPHKIGNASPRKERGK